MLPINKTIVDNLPSGRDTVNNPRIDQAHGITAGAHPLFNSPAD
jgi:hypothetical protein